MTAISARTLGQRIRQLRMRRGFTQQDLAGDDYSKSYISAIEQGKTRPSLEALQRISARLDVTPGALLDVDAQGFVPFDPEALPRRIRRRRNGKGGVAARGPAGAAQIEYQILSADLMITTGRAAEARAALRSLLPEEGGAGNRLAGDAHLHRLYSLAARAAIETGHTDEALSFAQKGIQLSSRLGDREGLERMRNIAGLALYHANQPLAALEHHRACLEAVAANAVRDPNFKLEVYRNIAADYSALHDNKRAIEAYESATELVEQLNSLEQQMSALEKVATEYAEHEDYETARQYAARALYIREAQSNMGEAARLDSRYGDALVEAGELEQAERRLTRSLEVAEKHGSELDRAVSLTGLARLYMKLEDTDKAWVAAVRALQVSRDALSARPKNGTGRRVAEEPADYTAEHMQVPANSVALRALAQALTLSGEVAARKGDTTSSERLFEEALEIVEQEQAADVSSDIYKRFAQVLAATGQHERASTYFERAYNAITNRGS